VFAALVEIQAALPFPLLGIDSDNGSEFINEHLLRWCVSQQITFTRSRPANENDGCHVEQQNWDIARRTFGLLALRQPRRGGASQPDLGRLVAVDQPVHPTAEAAHKTRVGAKVTKTYDTAQTPYQRLLAHLEALDDLDPGSPSSTVRRSSSARKIR
jgi:hypothetical protein